MSLPAPDWARAEALAMRAADGDRGAQRDLVEAMWPVWSLLVQGSRSMGSLGKSDDHVRDVLTHLVEKLSKQDGRGLRLYRPWRERHPDKGFEDWMRIVVANAVRDHVRERLGDTRAPAAPGDPSVKRLLNEFSQSPLIEKIGARPPMTAAQTARQLLEFAQDRLPADQYGALTRWIEGASFEEIEEELGLQSDAARKLVRAAIAVLRRQFAGESEP